MNNLKTVVEGLLATHSTDVWSTYGGLNRVTKEVERILYHGLRSTQVRYIIIKLKPISNPIIWTLHEFENVLPFLSYICLTVSIPILQPVYQIDRSGKKNIYAMYSPLPSQFYNCSTCHTDYNSQSAKQIFTPPYKVMIFHHTNVMYVF